MTGGLLIVDTAFVPPGSSFGRRAGALAAETSCATAGKLSGCRGFSGGCSGRRAAGGGRGGAGAAPGGGGRAGAGPCRGATLGSDARRRGRAAASVQCARAAAGVRVPAFPFLPAAPLVGRTASGPLGPDSAGWRGEARSGDGGRGVAVPRSHGPPHGAPESERGGQRAGCTAAATPGGCRPRPPAAQALPLFSPPPALSRTPCKEARPVCSSRAARSRT